MKTIYYILILFALSIFTAFDSTSHTGRGDDLSGLWRSDMNIPGLDIFLEFTLSDGGYTLYGYEYYGEDCYIKSPMGRFVSLGGDRYRIVGGDQNGDEGSFTVEEDILTALIEDQSPLTYTRSDRTMSPLCGMRNKVAT